MDTRWYFRDSDKVNGPYNSSQLKQLAQSGHIKADTEVRRDDGNWVRAVRIEGLMLGHTVKDPSLITETPSGGADGSSGTPKWLWALLATPVASVAILGSAIFMRENQRRNELAIASANKEVTKAVDRAEALIDAGKLDRAETSLREAMSIEDATNVALAENLLARIAKEKRRIEEERLKEEAERKRKEEERQLAEKKAREEREEAERRREMEEAEKRIAEKKRLEELDRERKRNSPSSALVYMVSDNPGSYDGRFVKFDKVRVHGDVDKEDEGNYRVGITDSRGEYYTSVGLYSNEIKFICSSKIANGVRALTAADKNLSARISCEINTRGEQAVATIYKMEFYNLGGNIGQTLED